MTEDLIRRVADELEIRNVIARLGVLADLGDMDEYISLFTEDALWEMQAPPGGKPLFPAIKGNAGIRAGAEKRRADAVSGPGTHNYHLLANTTVNITGDTATATSYMAFVKGVDKTPNVAMLTIYHDQFRRTSDGWKLAARMIQPG